MYYTIGQRRGLNLGGNEDKYFVVGKDLNKNILYTACGENNPYLYSDSVTLESVNFISDERPITATAKFRYRQPDVSVNIEYLEDGNLIVPGEIVR